MKWPLAAWYYGSYPWRWWRNQAAEAAGRAPIMVLFYHRIADDGATPWTLSNRAFERQILFLKRHVELVSVEECQRRIRARRNVRTCVSITFDDGYADNCHRAIPFLIHERVPTTYFVSLRNVQKGSAFPHDAVRGQRLQPNSMEQVREMARAGIEIGLHTRTHCDLGRVTDPARLVDEVVTAGEELQEAIQRAVRYFAFPFGQPPHLNPMAFHLAYEAGFEGVCSAYGGYNWPGDDPFHLQRIHADDFLRLKNWITVDPRKEKIPRFQYEVAVPVADPLEVR